MQSRLATVNPHWRSRSPLTTRRSAASADARAHGTPRVARRALGARRELGSETSGAARAVHIGRERADNRARASCGAARTRTSVTCRLATPLRSGSASFGEGSDSAPESILSTDRSNPVYLGLQFRLFTTAPCGGVRAPGARERTHASSNFVCLGDVRPQRVCRALRVQQRFDESVRFHQRG